MGLIMMSISWYDEECPSLLCGVIKLKMWRSHANEVVGVAITMK